MKDNKLVFFDIDGTLINSVLGINEIPKSAINSIYQLRENNHRAFIATGRCYSFINDSVLRHPFDGFVTCNGAYVNYQGNCIMKSIIPQIAIQRAIDFAEKNDTILYLESNDNIYVVNGDKKEHLEFANHWEMKQSIQVHDFNPNDIEVYIGMMLVNDESQFQPLINDLSRFFNVQQHPNQLSFDLTLKNTSKAVGIKKLVKSLGYNMKDIYAFGDGNNDLEMISSVGYGIAMGNAVEPLKKVAFDVTDSVENDGIKKALIKYGIIEEKLCIE